MLVDFYVDVYIVGLWGHENNQELICDISRTGFVVFFQFFSIVGVKNTDIY